MSHQIKNAKAGVTLVEVLFAIGIITVGLAFIASIIPLASRQALDSYTLTRSSQLGQNAFREVLVRKLFQPTPSQPWIGIDDLNGQFLQINGFGDIHGNPIEIDAVDASEGICIDPMFWASQPGARDNKLANIPIASNSKSIQRSRFPFYNDAQSPLVNHFAIGPNGIGNPWVQTTNFSGVTITPPPRMLRMTLPVAATPALSLIPMRSKQAQTLFGVRDDVVSQADPQDRSQRGLRGFYGTQPPTAGAASTQMEIVQGVSASEMTWFMTLTPHEQFVSPTPRIPLDQVNLQDYYTLSIVVLGRRDRSFSVDPVSVTDLPVDERIAWVLPTSTGNGGGNGMSVQLIANANVDPKVSVGDWMMLSRAVLDPNTNAYHKHIHRWFRVTGVDKEARALNTSLYPNDPGSDPFGNDTTGCWVRNVQLMGPGWSFSQNEPTVATLVKGVTSVYERVIVMQK